jgi:hypothetical protein
MKHVNLVCPKCNMFCKAEQPKVEVYRDDDRVAYGHERCYRVNDEGDRFEDYSPHVQWIER